jgi:spermidine synthase
MLLFGYGLVEAFIGVWALLFPLLFAAVRALSFAVPHGAGGLGFAVDVLFAALLILPPAVCMGGTIPLLTQALARSLGDATRFHAFVYAFNTAGAFFGALSAGFFLVPHLGLPVTVVTMGCVNLGAGAAFLVLGRKRQATRAAPATSRSGTKPPPQVVAGFTLYAIVAFLGGFAMMVMQTVLNRMGGLAFGASHFTFAMVVAVFVLCIALGSFAVAAFARIPNGAVFLVQAALALVLALLYLPLQDAPYWAHELRLRFGHADADFYPFYFSAFGALLAVFAIPIGLSGAVLPLLFHVLRRQVSDLGDVAGRLYSWNTLGSVAGALLGGYAMLFWLDLHHVYRMAVVALAASAALLAGRLLAPRRALLARVTLVLLVLGLVALPRWSPIRLSSGPFRSTAPLGPSGHGPGAFFAGYEARVALPFYDDDPTSSVAVWEGKKPGPILDRAIVNNGKSDGAIPGDYCTMGLAGVLPALLADRAERAFVIGFGTGVTAGVLGRLESMRQVDVAEIASGVVRAAPLFDYGNLGAASNPKVHLLRADAYRALLRSPGGYDVIASEPSNPWVNGIEMLYSREFLATARERLAPGGVYAQWIHLYETDTATVTLVLSTYRAVFDHVAVWYALGDDLILLGFKENRPVIDLGRLAARAELPDYRAALALARIHGFGPLLAHELLPLGVLDATVLPKEIHTLFRPRLAQIAARAFFRGGVADLPPTMTPEAAAAGARNSLLSRYTASFPGGLPDSLRLQVLVETFWYRPKLGATLLAQWQTERPTSPQLGRLLENFWRSEKLHQGLQPADFARLQALLGGDPAALAGDCDAARRTSALFETYYHHAAPFRRDALLEAWRNCPEGRAGLGSNR